MAITVLLQKNRASDVPWFNFGRPFLDEKSDFCKRKLNLPPLAKQSKVLHSKTQSIYKIIFVLSRIVDLEILFVFRQLLQLYRARGKSVCLYCD